MQSDYITVRLPKELIDEVDRIVKAGLRGYKSRAEFVKEAIRIKLDEVKPLLEEYAPE